MTAPTGECGVELARSRRPQLILLELGPPSTSRIEVITSLRESKETYLIPIVGLSSAPCENVPGLSMYCRRPIPAPEFLAMLRVLLRRAPDTRIGAGTQVARFQRAPRVKFGQLALTVALATLTVGNLCCSAASGAAPPATAPAAEATPAETAPAPPAAPPGSSATLLRFLALGRGDQMADLGSGADYSILPFANAVGPYGRVYARHAPKVSQHLPSDALYDTPSESLPPNIVLMATPLDAPFLAQVKELDAVTFLFGYHALITEHRDRARFNAAVLRALKPGGLFVIAEPVAGGTAGVQVDAATIRGDLESVGFRFVEAADSLPPGIDDGAGGAARAPATVLKFQRPR